MSKLHNFNTQLQWSEKSSDAPFWDAVYRELFPSMVNHMQTVGDYQSQRMGIDRIIFLSNGRVIRVDEKKRSKNYGDIALETHHTKEKNIHSEKVADGWIKKNLFIDYLTYAIMPTQTVYVFDWLLLRRAWDANYEGWYRKAILFDRNGYSIATAHNPDYWSHSLCVPITDLQSAVQNASTIQLNISEAAA